MTFNTSKPFETLEPMSQQDMDQLDFGVIRMDRNARIKAYNKFESDLSGKQVEEVLGKDFFQQVAPCTNNFMVAEKYNTEAALDEELDYIFTYLMQPTKVKLRMLCSPGQDHQYLLVQKS
jgi:photoactive yellow protein